MNSKLLFPAKLRYLGYLLTLPGLILGYWVLMLKYEIPWFSYSFKSIEKGAEQNFTNELALALVIVGSVLIAFSKVKREDELTSRIRLIALYWAILINYSFYAIIFLFVQVCLIFNIHTTTGILGQYAYYWVFEEYNLFTPLLIFIGVFYYLLYSHKNEFIMPVRYLPYQPFGRAAKWILIVAIALWLSPFFMQNWIILPEGISRSSLQPYYSLPIFLIAWILSRKKTEDEYIESIRMESMQIAVYINYAVLLISNFACYGLTFSMVEGLNLFTIPIIFKLWFEYRMYRMRQQEEVKAVLS